MQYTQVLAITIRYDRRD